VQSSGVLGGAERDDEPREDVVGVVYVRVPLHDEGVAALVADAVQRLAVPDHVHLLARPRRGAAQPRAPEPTVHVAARGLRAQRAQQHERDQGHRAPPRGRVRRRHGRRAQLRAPPPPAAARVRRGHARGSSATVSLAPLGVCVAFGVEVAWLRGGGTDSYRAGRSGGTDAVWLGGLSVTVS
jgi:hypothetical protein